MKNFLLLLLVFTSFSLLSQTNISPSNSSFQYRGRIDFSDASAPKLYYAGSSIHVKFTGTSLKAKFSDENWGGGNHIGFIIDGGSTIVRNVSNNANNVTVDVASGLSNTTHDLIITKRTTAGHGYLQFHGLILDNSKTVSAPSARPARRVELFGDSVTEGANADNNVDQEGGDSKNSGWNSYGMIMARNLGAECHNQGIGGLAVQNGTGYYQSHAGGIGLESTYDKISPNADRQTNWNFSNYTPHLVIMAMGINDDGFVDNSNKETWKNKYKSIINDLRNNKYPNADFVLTVPPLGYERTKMEGYVQEIVNELNDPDVHYYNITATVPANHPYDVIHQEMATELTTFVNSLDINWGGGGTPPPTYSDDIVNVTAPNSVTPGSNATVTVNYEASTARDIHVVFQKDSPDWDGYGSAVVDVSAGSGTVDVIVPINSSTPVANDAYQFQTFITTNGGGWNERLDNLSKINVDAVSGGGGSGSETITVRARMINGSADNLELRINDATIKTWSVNSSSFANYAHTVSSGGNVKLYFPDNATDMEIDYLQVGSNTYQAENQSTNTSVWQNGSCGGSNSQLMHCKGYIDFGNISIGDGGGSSSGNVVIRARGNCGSESMQLRINGTTVLTQTVSTSYTNYTYDGYSSGTIAVHFTNDGNSSGCDRNLYVDYIDVCGTRIQSESSAVTQTSTWTNGDKQILFTNGNNSYGNPGCSSSRFVSSEYLNEDSAFSIYPNPVTSGRINILTDLPGDLHVQLFSLNGKIVQELSLSDGQRSFDTELSQGIYLLKIATVDETYTSRIIMK